MSIIRLMGQNVWNCTGNLPTWEERGLDCSSAVRMKGHVRILEELLPDVLGGQEVNMQMQLDLKQLQEEKASVYAAYQDAKAERRKIETILQNVDLILKTPSEPAPKHMQERP